MNEGEWNSDYCSVMKKKLLNKLDVQEKSEQKSLDALRSKLDMLMIKVDQITDSKTPRHKKSDSTLGH